MEYYNRLADYTVARPYFIPISAILWKSNSN
jgi:hypothetical protein